MNFDKMSVMYACIYCRKKTTFDKPKIVQHFKHGCRKMKNRCNHSLIIEVSATVCYVYMNEKNVHLDVKKDILPLVNWPSSVQYFTTTNDWKTLHYMDSDWSSSENDDKEDD